MSAHREGWPSEVLRTLIWVGLVIAMAVVMIGLLASRASTGAPQPDTPLPALSDTPETLAPSQTLTGTATSDSGIIAAPPSLTPTRRTPTVAQTGQADSLTPTLTSTIEVTPGTCPHVAYRQTTIYAGPGTIYTSLGELAEGTPVISDGWYYAAGYTTWLRIACNTGSCWVRAEDLQQTVDTCITPFVDFTPPPPTYTPTTSPVGATFTIPADIGLTHDYSGALPTSGGSTRLVVEVRVEGIRPFYETQDENASRRWLVLGVTCESGAVLWDYYGTSPIRLGCGSSASAVIAAGAPTVLFQFELPSGGPSAVFTLSVTVRDFAEYAP